MAKTTDKNKPIVKETGNKRGNGQFAPGNKIGNRFQPGVSGNPAGRPKARTLSEDLRVRLREQYPGRTDATYQRMIAEKLVDEGVAGNMAAIREIFDRTEGKPRQTMDLTVEERRRELAENAIIALMAEAGIERDAAIEQLAAVAPEIHTWVN
jgi:hypothetical protein